MFGMLNFRPHMMSCLQKCHPLDRDPKTSVPNDLDVVGFRNRAIVQARRLRASRVDHNLTKRPLSVPDAWHHAFVEKMGGKTYTRPPKRTKFG